MLTVQQLQVLTDNLENRPADLFRDLIQCFPFGEMININMMNFDLITFHIKFLTKASQKSDFYMKSKPVNCTFEFILNILQSLANSDFSNILCSTLKLLRFLISRSTDIRNVKEFIHENRERLLEAIAYTTKLNIFHTGHVADCAAILYDILTVNGVLPLITSRILAEITEIFKGLQVVYELAVLCNLVMKRYIQREVHNFNGSFPVMLSMVTGIWTEVFNSCKETDEPTLLELLKAINTFNDKFSPKIYSKRYEKSNLFEAYKECLSTLPMKLDSILSFCNRPTLRNESIRLLSLVLTEPSENREILQEELQQLPVDVQDWPKTKSLLYFNMCTILFQHNRNFWMSSEILKSIDLVIYSPDRFSMKAPLLKSLCYIYPIVMVGNLQRSAGVLGDDILILMKNHSYALEHILTIHIGQLAWILYRGDSVLKQKVLCFWLKHDKDDDVLMKVLVHYKSMDQLLEILLNKHLEEDVCNRAVEIAHKLQHPLLSKKIVIRLPIVWKNRKIFNRLISCQPEVPYDMNLKLSICRFMSTMLVFIVDENILKLACMFTKKLVVSLRAEKDIVELFTQDLRTIKFLLVKIKYVGDDTVVDIISLVKALLLVQRRNHTSINTFVQVDISHTLIGNSFKLHQCLDLLQLILKSKDLFIKLDILALEKIVIKLFDLCAQPDTAVQALICLTAILKKHRWLAVTPTMALFVRFHCSLGAEEPFSTEFISFLTYWLKILRMEGNISCLARLEIVENYIQRVPHIATEKAEQLLRLATDLRRCVRDKLYPYNKNVLLYGPYL